MQCVGSVERGNKRVSNEVQGKRYVEVKVRVKDDEVEIYMTGGYKL